MSRSQGFAGSGDALRVSFNSAEADLSFPNLQATQLFSIPEGFEEFLGSTMMDVKPNGHLAGSQSLAMQASSALMGNGPSGMSNLDTSIPAFSTLIGPWYETHVLLSASDSDHWLR